MPTPQEARAALLASGRFALADEPFHDGSIKVYANAPASMREILLDSRRYGERVFTVYEDETTTFDQFFQRAAALARRMTEAGIVKGDRVAVGMRNYPEWPVAFFACQAIGAIVVALNAWWTTAELEFALEDSEPAGLLIDGERLERLAPLLKAHPPKFLAVARRGGAGPGGLDFDEAMSGEGPLPDVEVGPHDLSTILYTSGTTGRPKGAMHAHRNHITNLMNGQLGGAVMRAVAGVPNPDQPPPVEGSAQAGALQTFPFFHIAGVSGIYSAVANGSKLALMYKWVPAEGVRLVETHKLSSAAGVPMVMRQLLEHARESGADLSSLAGVAAGGAPVPPDLIKRIGDQFQSRASAGNGYGLTETTSAVISNGGPEYFAHPDSIGRPGTTAQIRIVGEDGQDVAQGDIGELWVRGPNVIPGYWRNPEATEAAFGGGWFRTGDLGYVDEAGLHYVVDRAKDVILRGGENVYSAEVEAAILPLPGVKDVAVLGLPHDIYGEEVAAVIQMRPEAITPGAEARIAQALEADMARFKIPTRIILTADELLRTGTGKLLKRELKSLYFPVAR